MANCSYVVTNQWNNGFTAELRIRNTGSVPINGWQVSWRYTGNNRSSGGWNAVFSGNNPYQAAPLTWNAQIQPGTTVAIGIQGTKALNTAAEVPRPYGAICQ